MDVTIYVRLSRDKQGDSLGVERQEDECRRFALARGWTVREVLVDNDLSATSGVERPAFEALLTSGPSAVLVWHLDRLIRLTRDLERVIALGVDVHAIQAGHLDLSTPAGRAVARTVTAWSTYEGELRTERQRAQQRQRADAGGQWWSVRPFGYEMDGTLREPEAAALRAVYDALLAGMSVSGQARALNDAGWLTTRGKPWTTRGLRQTVIAARNAGVLTHNGEEVGKGAWSALVGEDVWRDTKRILEAPGRLQGRGGRVTTLLAGVGVCGVCGGSLRGSSWKHKMIYECATGKHVRALREWLDGQVVWHLLFRRPEGAGTSGEASEAGPLRAQVADLNGRMAALSEDYAEGVITREQLRAGTAKLRGKVQEAEAALARAAADTFVFDDDDIEYMAYHWDELTLERQRLTIQACMVGVVLHRRSEGSRFRQPEEVQIVWRM